MAKVNSIIPAVDWYFVHEGHKEPVVWPLAAWGVLAETGETVGLIGAFGRDQGQKGKTPCLDVVPAVPGRYLHYSELTKEERDLAGKRSQQDSAPV